MSITVKQAKKTISSIIPYQALSPQELSLIRKVRADHARVNEVTETQHPTLLSNSKSYKLQTPFLFRSAESPAPAFDADSPLGLRPIGGLKLDMSFLQDQTDKENANGLSEVDHVSTTDLNHALRNVNLNSDVANSRGLDDNLHGVPKLRSDSTIWIQSLSNDKWSTIAPLTDSNPKSTFEAMSVVFRPFVSLNSTSDPKLSIATDKVHHETTTSSYTIHPISHSQSYSPKDSMSHPVPFEKSMSTQSWLNNDTSKTLFGSESAIEELAATASQENPGNFNISNEKLDVTSVHGVHTTTAPTTPKIDILVTSQNALHLKVSPSTGTSASLAPVDCEYTYISDSEFDIFESAKMIHEQSGSDYGDFDFSSIAQTDDLSSQSTSFKNSGNQDRTSETNSNQSSELKSVQSNDTRQSPQLLDQPLPNIAFNPNAVNPKANINHNVAFNENAANVPFQHRQIFAGPFQSHFAQSHPQVGLSSSPQQAMYADAAFAGFNCYPSPTAPRFTPLPFPFSSYPPQAFRPPFANDAAFGQQSNGLFGTSLDAAAQSHLTAVAASLSPRIYNQISANIAFRNQLNAMYAQKQKQHKQNAKAYNKRSHSAKQNNSTANSAAVAVDLQKEFPPLKEQLQNQERTAAQPEIWRCLTKSDANVPSSTHQSYSNPSTDFHEYLEEAFHDSVNNSVSSLELPKPLSSINNSSPRDIPQFTILTRKCSQNNSPIASGPQLSTTNSQSSAKLAVPSSSSWVQGCDKLKSSFINDQNSQINPNLNGASGMQTYCLRPQFDNQFVPVDNTSENTARNYKFKRNIKSRRSRGRKSLSDSKQSIINQSEEIGWQTVESQRRKHVY